MGALFIGMFFMVLIMRPGVVTGDAPARPSQQENRQPEAVRSDVGDISKIISMFELLIEKIDRKDNQTSSPVIDQRGQDEDRAVERVTARQQAQEDLVRYHGNDPIVRERLGLGPRVSSDRVTADQFDRQYERRFSN
jgi:hypothetical protein